MKKIGMRAKVIVSVAIFILICAIGLYNIIFMTDVFSAVMWGVVIAVYIVGIFTYLVSVIRNHGKLNHSETYVLEREVSVDGLSDLEKLVKYGKRRAMLEEKMKELTENLALSEMAQFIDVNALALYGQREYSDAIDLGFFLRQYHIEGENSRLKPRTMVFLSPFDEESQVVYESCESAVSERGFAASRTDNYMKNEDILENIVKSIVQAELIIANINGKNANVFYELGIAHTLGKETVLISKMVKNIDEIEFDIRQKRVILYDDMHDLRNRLLRYMDDRAVASSGHGKI